MPHDPKLKNEKTLKAGALLCPVCCVELQEAQVDIEWEGKVLHDIKVLRCPSCEEELFTPEQQSAVATRIKEGLF